MVDQLPTVWAAEPHTLVKHAILKRYLQAWFPILSQQAATLRKQFGSLAAREILFIDGFAGPGEYKGGEPGSPVIALDAALKHAIPFPMPVRMLFIESRMDRFDHLQGVLEPYLMQAQASPNIHAVDPSHGDCDNVLNTLLDDLEEKRIKFGPALAFLDQFGYSAVSMELIARILSFGQCEVFAYLDYKDMNRWITDERKWPAFTRAYGGDEWKQCINEPENRRRALLLDKYKWALRERGNADYVVSFLMFDRNKSPLYWLLFCTNNLRGLEEMKKAMWHVDKTGGFRFSDRDDPDQLRLLEDSFSQQWLAEELAARLSNRTLTIAEVKEYVLVETPCYLFKAALKLLETSKQGKLTVVSAPAERRPGKFPEEKLSDIVVRFGASLFAE